jgi:hypothetical protein
MVAAFNSGDVNFVIVVWFVNTASLFSLLLLLLLLLLPFMIYFPPGPRL